MAGVTANGRRGTATFVVCEMGERRAADRRRGGPADVPSPGGAVQRLRSGPRYHAPVPHGSRFVRAAGRAPTRGDRLCDAEDESTTEEGPPRTTIRSGCARNALSPCSSRPRRDPRRGTDRARTIARPAGGGTKADHRPSRAAKSAGLVDTHRCDLPNALRSDAAPRTPSRTTILLSRTACRSTSTAGTRRYATGILDSVEAHPARQTRGPGRQDGALGRNGLVCCGRCCSAFSTIGPAQLDPSYEAIAIKPASARGASRAGSRACGQPGR